MTADLNKRLRRIIDFRDCTDMGGLKKAVCVLSCGAAIGLYLPRPLVPLVVAWARVLTGCILLTPNKCLPALPPILLVYANAGKHFRFLTAG
jgi:hypothetical protein